MTQELDHSDADSSRDGVPANGWVYQIDDAMSGPVSSEELAELVKSGSMQPETPVCEVGEDDWKPFSQSAATQNDEDDGGDSPVDDVTDGTILCGDCGVRMLPEYTTLIDEKPVCDACRTDALQRLKLADAAKADAAAAAAIPQAELTRRAHFPHEAQVRIAGYFFIALGLASSLFGLFILSDRPTLSVSPAEAGQAFDLGMISGLSGPVAAIMGFHIISFRRWARYAAMLWTGALVGISVLEMVSDARTNEIMAIGIVYRAVFSGYLFWVFACGEGRRIFEDDYKAILASTPDMKLRTPLIVLIFWGFALGAFGLILFKKVYG